MWFLMELLALVTSVLILSLVSQTECDNMSCAKIERRNMKFNLRSKGKFARFKCNKGYELLGHATAVCQSSGAWSVEIPRCIGPTCAAIPNTPGLVIDSLKNGALLKFSCSTGKVRDGVDSIYCEDDKWSALPPVCKEGVSMGCDFEGGLCGWSHDTSDDFDWTRNRGETPTADTGPLVDHTTNSVHGHYLFAESSSPQEAGKKTRLISPIYNPDSVVGLCLEFYYHMFGTDGDGNVGQLDVYIKPKDISPDKLTFKHQRFHKEGNQGDQWMKADFEIPEEKQPFQIVFQVTILNSWTSDIAIDDIRLHNCKEVLLTIVYIEWHCRKLNRKNFTSDNFHHRNVIQTTISVSQTTDSPKHDDVGNTTTTTPTPTTKVTPKRKPLVTGAATARTASGVNTTPATIPVVTTNRPSTALKTTTKATTVTTSTKSTITTTTTAPNTNKPKPTTTTPRPTTTTSRTTKTTTRPTTTTPRPTTTTSRTTTTTPKPTTTTPRSTSTSTRPTTTSMKPTTTALKTTSANTGLTSAAVTTRVQPATPASVATTTAAPTPATTVNAGLDTSTPSSAYGRTTSDTTTGTTSDTAARTTSDTAARTTSTSSEDKEDKDSVEDTNDDIDTTDDDDKSDNTGDDDTDDEDGEDDVDDTPDGDNNSTAADYIDNGITNAHHSFDTDDNGNNSSPVVDYDRRYKPGDSKVGDTGATDVQDGSEASAGSVKEGHGDSGTKELLPLIIGVVASVVVGAVVIAGLAYMWARNQRRKREKEEDDQMNIITEYVETNLNV
ncbi:unnamed protein product [Lymnaea stagnalis]|uniref:Uncharacterized protein n=1 Tax=Lymnaea stagnalis TaxID=6523 RepID=A0AAV2HFP5_LYMST